MLLSGFEPGNYDCLWYLDLMLLIIWFGKSNDYKCEG